MKCILKINPIVELLTKNPDHNQYTNDIPFGNTDNKLKITVTPQNLILLFGRVYPKNDSIIIIINSTKPEYQTFIIFQLDKNKPFIIWKYRIKKINLTQFIWIKRTKYPL